MKRRSRLAGLAAVAASAALALTACSGGGSGDAEGVTTITFLSWTGEEQMEQVIDAFEEDHPEVRVEASYAPPVAEYIQALQTRVLSGTAPDVFVIAAENKTNLIEGGHVLDLSGEDFVEGVEPFNLETYGRDGKYYGLSLSSWAAGYIYNTELLAQVGYESVPETWDEFLEMCQKLQDAGITPFLESVDQMPTTVSAWIGARNADMDGSLDDQIFDGESSFAEQWTPALEQYDRVFEEGLMSKDVVGLDGDQVRDEFANGRVAVINGGPWFIAALREANPDLDFRFSLVPAMDESGEPFAAGAAAPGYAINAKSDEAKQEAAKTFLGWLAEPEAVELFQSLTNDVTVTANFEPPVDPAFEPMVEPIRNGRLYLPMIAWKRAEDVLNVEAVAQVQRMIRGEVEPEQVAEALDTKLAAS